MFYINPSTPRYTCTQTDALDRRWAYDLV